MPKFQQRIFYTTTVSSVILTHQLNMFINVTSDPSPGELPGDIDITLKGGGTDIWTGVVNDLYDLVKPLYHTTVDFIRAELWRADDADSEDYTYISTAAIGLQGTSANAVIAAQQNTFTFRSVLGKSSRVQLMESSLSGTNKEAIPTANATVNALANFVAGSTSPFVTRHGDFIVVPVNLANGQNERLARRRFRST